MEEWINAVTLSLNAEMEKEKELREKAAAALAEVLEGEDLDAIEAALQEAVAKGVAEEVLAKARATHKVAEAGVGAAGGRPTESPEPRSCKES